MEPEELEFLYFWVREVENERTMHLGKLLGTAFRAGDIRDWAKKGEQTTYKKNDVVLMPLTLALRPDLREALIRMVGAAGLALPKGYTPTQNEQVVDLGQVSPQEFIDFVQKKKLPAGPARADED